MTEEAVLGEKAEIEEAPKAKKTEDVKVNVKDVCWSLRNALQLQLIDKHAAKEAKKYILILAESERDISGTSIGTVEAATMAIRKLYIHGSVSGPIADDVIAGIKLIIELGKGGPVAFKSDKDACTSIRQGALSSKQNEGDQKAIYDGIRYLYHGRVAAPVAPKKAAKKAAKKKEK